MRWCGPEAPALVESVVVPEVPAEALDPVCPLRSETTDALGYYPYNASVQYEWDGTTVLWITWLSASGPTNLMRVELDGAGRKVGMTWGQARSDRRSWQAWEPLYSWRWDGDGHLTRHAIDDDGGVLYEVTQAWSEGLLVARHEDRLFYVEGDYERRLVVTTWSYDGEGRLVSAATENGDVAASATWTYDDARPTGVTRMVDGDIVEQVRWSYDGAGNLTHRRVARFGDAAPLDTLTLTSSETWDGDPWANALPAVRADGCTALPTSLEHGYPDAEVIYRLGTPVAERPHGIGFAYGASTYGWNYGDLGWFGHEGVVSFQPSFEPGPMTIETRYELGVMVEETLARETGWLRSWHRQRTLVDGAIVKDRLEVEIALTDNDGVVVATTPYGRELIVSRDAYGHLSERRLVDDEAGLLERQMWSHDAAGRWLSHTVMRPSYRAALPRYSEDSAWCPFDDGCSGEPTMVAAEYARMLDHAGRAVELTTTEYDRQGEIATETAVAQSYDAAGRLVQVVGPWGQVETYRYDDVGGLVEETSSYGQGDEKYVTSTTTTYDARGRWTVRESRTNGALTNVATRAFNCVE